MSNAIKHKDISRSILQKAVRRGQVNITHEIIEHLYEHDSYKWLYSRTAVILAEECWPLLSDIPSSPSIKDIDSLLATAAASTKNKDAAGLGSLAYLRSKNISPHDSHVFNNYHVRLVSEAIRRPKDFWIWANEASETKSSKKIINNCENFHRLGGWPWDMAFLIAAAYLSIKDVPNVSISDEIIPLPTWIAVDKHTKIGKIALRNVCARFSLNYEMISKLAFYLEGAKVNTPFPGEWWDADVSFAMSIYSNSNLQKIWNDIKPYLAKEIDYLLSQDTGDFHSTIRRLL